MQNYSKIRLFLLIFLLAGALVLLYTKIDTASKACYLFWEDITHRKELTKTANAVNLALTQGDTGPMTGNTKAKELKAREDRRKIVVSRNGKSREYWIRSVIWQAYDDIGGIKSILGVPTSDEYRWKGGIRQDFERGYWLFWSKLTGVKMNYNPPGYGADNLSPLESPIYMNGKPAVEWSDGSDEKYFITQDFGTNGHLGQDLALNGNPNPGYEVHPVTEGKVVFSGWTGGNSYGYCVLVQHSLGSGRNYYSQYSHLYDIPLVFAGQLVNKETVLGRIGDTGKSTGPHLDFQIKEIPRVDNQKGMNVTPSDLGYGYSPGRSSFEGNIYYDSRTGQTYYKPSYLIKNYKNNPGALISDFHRILDLTLPFKRFPSLNN